MMRRVIAVLAATVLLCLCATGCGKKATNNVTTVYKDKEVGFQLEMPELGDQIAIMHTSLGDISIRFFPEAAPKAVTNFIELSKKGYYNNLTFHRVIANFMVQGGDPKGNGTGGESYWGKHFEDEFDTKLLNLRGALSMANSGVNTNGSQFFINLGSEQIFGKSYSTLEKFKEDCDKAEKELKVEYNSLIESYGKDKVEKTYGSFEDVLARYAPNASALAPSEAAWALYKQHGGNLHLDGAWRRSGGHTVFGQVFNGMDVVLAIGAVETDSDDKPLTDVIVKSIEITTYYG